MENAYISKMLDGLHRDRDKANERLDAAELEFTTKREAITKELAEITEAETRLMREGKGMNALIQGAEEQAPANGLNRLRRTDK